MQREIKQKCNYVLVYYACAIRHTTESESGGETNLLRLIVGSFTENDVQLAILRETTA